MESRVSEEYGKQTKRTRSDALEDRDGEGRETYISQEQEMTVEP